MEECGCKKRFNPRNKGQYRFRIPKIKRYRMEVKREDTHLICEGALSELTRMAIEAINATRND